MIQARDPHRLARVALNLVLQMQLQLVLGIITTLFADIPQSHPGAGQNFVSASAYGLGWALTHTWPWLALHVINGVGILAQAITLMLRSRLITLAGARMLAAAGFAAVMLAAAFGLAYLDYKQDVYSLLMTLGAAIGTGCYAAIVYVARAESGA